MESMDNKKNSKFKMFIIKFILIIIAILIHTLLSRGYSIGRGAMGAWANAFGKGLAASFFSLVLVPITDIINRFILKEDSLRRWYIVIALYGGVIFRLLK